MMPGLLRTSLLDRCIHYLCSCTFVETAAEVVASQADNRDVERANSSNL